MLSVLIPALNEHRNIADCLRSVRWADEVVVVDSGSTDGTCELARSEGARVVNFKWNGQLPKKKNWALEFVEWKHEWVLILDADERITPELAHEIKGVITKHGADGYFINRRFMFLGKWLRHCGYYPSWNLRLFRHAKGRYENLCLSDTGSGDNEIHEHLLLTGSTAFLRHEMLHFAYPDLYTWFEKHNRYSNWEAEIQARPQPVRQLSGQIGIVLARRRRLKNWSRQLPFRPGLRFLYSYVLRFGFLDGYQGYIFCRLLATYEMMSAFKARELQMRGR